VVDGTRPELDLRGRRTRVGDAQSPTARGASLCSR
jgi:hypothetical protein